VVVTVKRVIVTVEYQFDNVKDTDSLMEFLFTPSELRSMEQESGATCITVLDCTEESTQ